jgi:hypothetical protein
MSCLSAEEEVAQFIESSRLSAEEEVAQFIKSSRLSAEEEVAQFIKSSRLSAIVQDDQEAWFQALTATPSAPPLSSEEKVTVQCNLPSLNKIGWLPCTEKALASDTVDPDTHVWLRDVTSHWVVDRICKRSELPSIVPSLIAHNRTCIEAIFYTPCKVVYTLYNAGHRLSDVTSTQYSAFATEDEALAAVPNATTTTYLERYTLGKRDFIEQFLHTK